MLDSLPQGIFDACYRLTDLRIHNNRLTSLPDCAFCNLTSLTTLYIGYDSNPLYNPITWLPRRLFPVSNALTTLYMQNLALSHAINASTFANLTQLTTFFLQGNDFPFVPNMLMCSPLLYPVDITINPFLSSCAQSFAKGASIASSCPVADGYYCAGPALSDCPAGAYCAAGAPSAPTPCPAGAFCPSATVYPQPCAAGWYSAAAGASVCVQCAAGAYSTRGATACAFAASSCPAGTFASPPGACAPCSPPSACPRPGLAAQLACAWNASTLAGNGAAATADGPALQASFRGVSGVATDALGNVVIADGTGNTIRNLSSGMVRTVAGGGYAGAGLALVNGYGTAANFSGPNFVAVDPLGKVLTCDSNFAACRPINASRFVGSIAGFNQPQGVAADMFGFVFVANRGTNQVLRITPQGVVWWYVGTGAAGCADGPVGVATLKSPVGLALAPDSQSIYVADQLNHAIRRVATASRHVTTLAGQCGVATFLDGAAFAASFNAPQGIAVDVSGAVYVGDTTNNAVRLLSPSGEVTTLSSRTAGFSNGPAPKFAAPLGLAVDARGNVLVADNGNKRLRLLECAPCPAGYFCASGGAQLCPGGHFCPSGTTSWARLNCGHGFYCPAGSAEPIPCPIQMAPLPYANWASHPLGAQGPAFMAETSSCRNHCFWNFTSGGGMLSTC